MKRIATCVTALILGFASVAQAQNPPVEVVDGVQLPGVPVGVSDQLTARPKQVAITDADMALFKETNVGLMVEPGTTELVPIAANHLNRIITPFENPKLITVNDIQFKKEGSSIFLTTSGEQPVSVHILSNDPNDTRGIALALVPRRIPPRTIKLSWPNHGAEGQPGFMHVTNRNPKAERWEQSSPYVETLMEMFALIARGEIPPGYTLVKTPDVIPCEIPGVSLFVGQRLSGSNFSVFVLRATNEGSSTIEIVQSAGCRANGVVAVAPWPNAYLGPGESTEVYVGVANEAYLPREQPNLRPSLLKY
jgi:conjugal transfer pilus assembly protein TraK